MRGTRSIIKLIHAISRSLSQAFDILSEVIAGDLLSLLPGCRYLNVYRSNSRSITVAFDITSSLSNQTAK